MAAGSYPVHVVDEATVVERGERVQIWFVRLADGWVRAHQHPEALEEEAHTDRGDTIPPGTIWQRQVELRLPRGTWLRKIVSAPRPERMQPMDYLTRGRSGVKRRLQTTWFRVVGSYRLEPVSEPPKALRDRKEPGLDEELLGEPLDTPGPR